MEPYLRHGDLVRIQAPARRAPRFGDVALVQLADGALRLHRLVWPLMGGEGARWRSQADQGAMGDGWVEVLATVAWAPRALGGARVALRSLIGQIVCRLREAVRK
jgi:hypothetical protein